jgi:hypothetical protein
MASHRLNLAAADFEICPTGSAKAARATLDLRFGHAISDEEWERARARLLEFATILRSWDLPVETDESEVGNVILLRQPRP